MNNSQSPLRFLTTMLAGVAMLLLSGVSIADPPSRVARLSFFSGPVSFSPAGEDEWALASANRPLITGDRLWADAGGRAELQAGSIALRLGASTSVNLLNLDDRTTQIELAQGSLYVRVWRLDQGDAVEIDTPNLAFTIDAAGRYRIDVDADGNVTTLTVLAGQGEAYGEGAGYRIGAGERYSFSETGLRDYEYSDIGPADEFDRWAADRDRRYDASPSARYVSRDVIGYQDLDQYGTWSVVAEYGNVWYPRSIAAGWAPYRTGHWAWIDPWGWTWIDEAPWGFAPYHYGRWAFVTGRWGWIPGPINIRPVYAPALVAFIGAGDLRLSLSVGGAASGVAWFPLGPGEVYQPAYRVSREYFTSVNISNTRVTNVSITNVYNNYTTNTTVANVTYRNREAPGAVTAVPATAFVQSQSVTRAAVEIPRNALMGQPVSAVARLAPTRASLVAAAATGAGVAAKPPARALQRDVVARTKPPAPPPAFAARQAALAANPGRPVEPAAAAQLQAAPTGATPTRNVKVVTPTQAAAPAPKDEGRHRQPGVRGPGAPTGATAGPQGTPQGPPPAPPGPGAGPVGGPGPKAAGPGAESPQGAEAARRARESGQSPAGVNKGANEAPAHPGAGQVTPVPRPPERRIAPPPQTPAPGAPPEGAKGPLPSSPAEATPPTPQDKDRGRNERRGPPEGGPGTRGGPGAPGGPSGAQGAPGAQAGPAAAPPPPRLRETRRDAPPQATPETAPPKEEPKREAPPRPPDAKAPVSPGPAAQPKAQEPKREAPKEEPKREEGKDRNKDRNKDKDPKDKDKKGSEG